MFENIDFAEGSASSALTVKTFESSVEASDNQYRKANRKGELKFTKLSSDNYQFWANGMKILLNVKGMWPLVTGIAMMSSLSRSNDCSKWLTNDAQAKTWIYTNLEDSQHNHIKGVFIANAM